MRVIAVTSQKGGSGKSTLSGHLAVQAERAGAGPVALVDCDPQGSLTNWWNSRKAETPVLLQTAVGRLALDLAMLRESGTKLVFIDTPPAITWTIVEVVKLADQVIIPVRPSPHDLAAAGSTVDLVESLNKPIIFVVNGATLRARITGEAAVALSQHGTVAPSVIHNRTDFAASMIDGRTVMEIAGARRSAEEIEKLWEYIAARIERTASGETNNAAAPVVPQAVPTPPQPAPSHKFEESVA
jgi:chromosome partitioning protein